MRPRFFPNPVLIVAGFASLALPGCDSKPASGEREQERPNILLILADDLGFSDLGCYGSEFSTPNLDRLAENGIRFTQFYNTAKSFPSRACLLTGLYAQQCGMSEGAGKIVNAVTLGEVLKEAGYRTLMVGKHHGTENPYSRGFDRYYGLRDGCCNYFNPGEQRDGEGVPAHKMWAYPRKWCIDEQLISPYTPEEEDFYTTDYFGNYALDYLEQYRDEDKPFFLYMAFTAPHDPLHAWPEDIDKYQGEFMQGYGKQRRERYGKQKEMGLIGESFPLSEPVYRDWEGLSDEEKQKEDRIRAVFAAMIDRMDRNIGRVLDKIEEMGELGNTLVMFCSDNGAQRQGPPVSSLNPEAQTSDAPIGTMTRWASLSPSWANVSNTPFRMFKEYSHSGGICSPLIVYWPEVIRGKNRISHVPGHFIDIMPTILEASGAVYPETYHGREILPCEGRSMVPVFRGEKPAARGILYFDYGNGKAIMEDGWKLVSWGEGPWELYNLETDKTETSDLSGEYPGRVARLDSLHTAWLKKMEQYYPEGDPD